MQPFHDTSLESSPGTTGSGGAPVRPLRVMVVDDNADAADALAAVAEMLGCEVRACYGGVAAVVAVTEDVPDVLLLDLSMPVVNGLEVAARARALAGSRPLLLVATTALGAWEDRAETALAGFHFHLVKPVDMRTLQAALDRFREVCRVTAATPASHVGPTADPT